MYGLSKTFNCEYAHRLDLPYESLCRYIHGHSGVCSVNIYMENVDENFMVMDFKELTEIKEWIDCTFDHSLILKENDSLVPVLKDFQRLTIVKQNPTAEYFARLVFDQVVDFLNRKGFLQAQIEVKFWETEKNCGIFRDLMEHYV